jgi:WD40 repeat protein
MIILDLSCKRTRSVQATDVSLEFTRHKRSKLASVSGDQTVRLWNVGTGQVEQTLEGHSDPVSSVAFSADGSKLASASGDRFLLPRNCANGFSTRHRAQVRIAEGGLERGDCGMVTVFGNEQNEESARM